MNTFRNMNDFKEYRKTATVKAKLFEKGDEDGTTIPEDFTILDAMENDKYGCGQPEQVPYISTLENQKHRGEFGKHYLCIGVNNERWLVDKEIFERTYEAATPSASKEDILALREKFAEVLNEPMDILKIKSNRLIDECLAVAIEYASQAAASVKGEGNAVEFLNWVLLNFDRTISHFWVAKKKEGEQEFFTTSELYPHFIKTKNT